MSPCLMLTWISEYISWIRILSMWWFFMLFHMTKMAGRMTFDHPKMGFLRFKRDVDVDLWKWLGRCQQGAQNFVARKWSTGRGLREEKRSKKTPRGKPSPSYPRTTISGDWKQYWKPFMINWSVHVYILIMYDMLIYYILSRMNMHVWYDKHGASQNIDV